MTRVIHTLHREAVASAHGRYLKDCLAANTHSDSHAVIRGFYTGGKVSCEGVVIELMGKVCKVGALSIDLLRYLDGLLEIEMRWVRSVTQRSQH